MRGDRKAHRTHQMRRDPQPDVTLGKRRAHAQKGSALQYGEIAMDQPRRGRGCARAEVALLQKDHPQAAPRGVARNADAVQPAADDRKIVVRHIRITPRLRRFTMARRPEKTKRRRWSKNEFYGRAGAEAGGRIIVMSSSTS